MKCYSWRSSGKRKNVDAEVVFQALEFALSTAAKKKADREHMDVRVQINHDTGEYQSFRRWLIVADEDYTYPDVEKTIEEIQEEIPALPSKSANTTKSSYPTEGFGRQAAQTAKQIILQRIRDAEREQNLNEFLAVKEDIVSARSNASNATASSSKSLFANWTR